MSIPFEIVKLYFVDWYTGWQVKEPPEHENYEEGYFIKIDGLYFSLGTERESYYVVEGE